MKIRSLISARGLTLTGLVILMTLGVFITFKGKYVDIVGEFVIPTQGVSSTPTASPIPLSTDDGVVKNAFIHPPGTSFVVTYTSTATPTSTITPTVVLAVQASSTPQGGNWWDWLFPTSTHSVSTLVYTPTLVGTPTETPAPQWTDTPVAPQPTAESTLESTQEPTIEPTLEPTIEPTEAPTQEPTPEPTIEPTEEPTVEPPPTEEVMTS